ncbi:type I pullulanase [Peribacillus simplex NBRC 15720 = DSM 1321]|uniref:Type I pullulanase n=1 Tax=Peribacillus simplex NBRC 15720 = DSM 1321 TaxID=1349754 RepID=A0A223EP18_9BACI|nr:type I pullulanase [Peribacillus simplex NBRC 15720 = DSM 1321]
MESLSTANIHSLNPAELDQLYFFEGKDLGNSYHKDKTAFRLWSPVASEVKLVTYEHWDDSNGMEIEMDRSEKGTWTVELTGDQDGLIYTYKVKVGEIWSEAVDPYVRAVTVNGDKGVVINLADTNPQKWTRNKPPLGKAEDIIIYELHTRDLSIHPESGIQHKGKFLGVIESGTKGPNGVKTGLDHIKDLGVTHVQFIPIFDFATVNEKKLNEPQYNWGYDPQNYNAPEGSYSTDPYQPKVRIRELKEMIQGLHDQGLRVIMDVVYNHVYSVADSNFNKLVPTYFFRYNADGTLSNGTGVGNDTASEHKMMRKFIVESVTYWAKEFNLDGFRFDLMGIHDVETMNEVKKALVEIDPTIIVLGEGWDMNTPLAQDQKANQKNARKMPGIAHFNDTIRDGLKGFVMNAHDKGFINGKPGMEDIIRKSIAAGLKYDDHIASYQKPDQVINYVEAHDNFTLWDKLNITNPEATEHDRKQMHKLASAIVLLSQGIPMIHAGQEFMRTKDGDENSYQSSDWVNRLDWKRRAEFDHEVEYMKGLISLRKNHSVFRLSTPEEIERHLQFIDSPSNVVAFTLLADDSKIAVIHNANRDAISITLPHEGNWSVLVNGQQAGLEEIERIKGGHITVPALSSFVLKQIFNG